MVEPEGNDFVLFKNMAIESKFNYQWTRVGETIFYDKERLMGKGSYGEVFDGQFTNGKNTIECAVKRIPLQLIGDDEMLQDRISAEIELMLAMDHENVLKAYTHEVTDEYIYIALERCDTDL